MKLASHASFVSVLILLFYAGSARVYTVSPVGVWAWDVNAKLMEGNHGFCGKREIHRRLVFIICWLIMVLCLSLPHWHTSFNQIHRRLVFIIYWLIMVLCLGVLHWHTSFICQRETREMDSQVDIKFRKSVEIQYIHISYLYLYFPHRSPEYKVCVSVSVCVCVCVFVVCVCVCVYVFVRVHIFTNSLPDRDGSS
jgi:hypothetical protein